MAAACPPPHCLMVILVALVSLVAPATANEKDAVLRQFESKDRIEVFCLGEVTRPDTCLVFRRLVYCLAAHI